MRQRILSPGERRKIIRLSASGMSQRQIISQMHIRCTTISAVLRPLGGVIRSEWLTEPSGGRLSFEDRLEIWAGLGRGESLRGIARRLKKAPSTISREVAANGGRELYKPQIAAQRSCLNGRRPKLRKLEANRELWERVQSDLEHLWSPQQIAARLRREFGDDASMTVSHETIYKSVYVQGRGELRRELARCLRSGRAARRPQGRIEKLGKLRDMVMISERPAEVDDRAVPGHWEGDLILGSKGAIGTLVERSTRFVMLLHLPKDRTAEEVRRALTAKIETLPAALRRTITWDQGKEMAHHVAFSVDTDVAVYFCDPHSPWQRGSNENTNGLLRQYFPKSTDLRVYTEKDLDAAADSLNGRPRQTLGWMTPSEKLAELVALTG